MSLPFRAKPAFASSARNNRIFAYYLYRLHGNGSTKNVFVFKTLVLRFEIALRLLVNSSCPERMSGVFATFLNPILGLYFSLGYGS
jgi:hypothetical protein